VPGGIALHRAETAPQRAAWTSVVMDGDSVPDHVAGPATFDSFDRVQLERAYRAMANEPRVEYWLAELDGRAVGGASLRLDAGVAQLNGAATHPEFRRRGVQTALLRARLQAAHAAGAELAVVTTQPGSRSQENVQRAGFALLYARAIWVRVPT
jgi:GNAT superfamily N-acetyltransferase